MREMPDKKRGRFKLAAVKEEGDRGSTVGDITSYDQLRLPEIFNTTIVLYDPPKLDEAEARRRENEKARPYLLLPQREEEAAEDQPLMVDTGVQLSPLPDTDKKPKKFVQIVSI